MELVSAARCFGGEQRVYKHASATRGCEMRRGVFRPPGAPTGAPAPALWFLSGLTCSEQNFITKAGAQRYAAARGLALIAPDTSPRGLDLPGEHDDWDFGSGAGFYLDATRAPWSSHYRMYSYLRDELPAALAGLPLDLSRQSITGHSMGGHGALVMALKNPGRFASASAFAPISSPSAVPWGIKAFTGYLGEDRSAWAAWDASELVRRDSARLPLLIDQGDADGFLECQLQPGRFAAACAEVGYPLTQRLQPGYDHSYYFIASFIGEHIDYHAEALGL